MADSGPRSIAATAVGWLILGIVLWVFFGSIFATIRFLFRTIAIVVVILGLLWVYFRLKAGGDGDD